MSNEEIIKTAIRYCDHNIYRIKTDHNLSFPKETFQVMKKILQGKEDLKEFNKWLTKVEKYRRS